MGAFIEYTLVTLLPSEYCSDPAGKVKTIKSIGAEHCIISTDLGQAYNPTPVEGMRLWISTLLRKGMGEAEIEFMAKANPAKLLGLD